MAEEQPIAEQQTEQTAKEHTTIEPSGDGRSVAGIERERNLAIDQLNDAHDALNEKGVSAEDGSVAMRIRGGWPHISSPPQMTDDLRRKYLRGSAAHLVQELQWACATGSSPWLESALNAAREVKFQLQTHARMRA